MKKILLAILTTAILFLLTSTPKIFVGTENATVAVINAEENLPLTIEFMHSVQKTPVIEYLNFQSGEFVLQRTKYKSQGVGLPFDASDGNFHRDGEWFVMDDMNRHFKNLELRTGKGTRLTIRLNDKTFKLYEKFPPGTKIIIKSF